MLLFCVILYESHSTHYRPWILRVQDGENTQVSLHRVEFPCGTDCVVYTVYIDSLIAAWP